MKTLLLCFLTLVPMFAKEEIHKEFKASRIGTANALETSAKFLELWQALRRPPPETVGEPERLVIIQALGP